MVQDKEIGKNVFQMSGVIATNNYLKIPDLKLKGGLGLTDPFLYIHVKPVPPKLFTVIVEVLSRDNFTTRITLSNMFRTYKTKGNVIQVPLDLGGCWYSICLDLPELLLRYKKEQYWCLSSITFCSSMLVKGAFTSDHLYSHEATGLSEEFPKEMQLSKLMKEECIWIPVFPIKSVLFDHSAAVPKQCLISTKPVLPKDGSSAKPLPIRVSSENSEPNAPTVSSSPTSSFKNAASSPTSSWKNAASSPTSSFKNGSSQLTPDPIMSIHATLGYSSQSARPIWSTNGKHVIFVHYKSIIIAPGDNMKQSQKILLGHTDIITSLALSKRSGGILASCQQGKNPLIRLWRIQDGEPLTVLAATPGGGLRSLDFSADGSFLCGVGRDEHHRTQLLVWELSTDYKFTLVAKQTSEFDITRLKFSPYNSSHLVSCGRENIRFWRVRKHHLPGCPVILNEYARNSIFTDLDFEAPGFPNEPLIGKRVFVSTNGGAVIVLNYECRTVECVFRVHDGPISCIVVNEGFCVTSSFDEYIRVWPLDFNDFFLEAKHDSPIEAIAVSPDGLKILAGTRDGTLGVLDMASQQYQSKLKSHSKEVTCVAFKQIPEHPVIEFATGSLDGSVCVWSIPSCEQLCEFVNCEDECHVVVFNRDTLVCGYQSGYVRVFHVGTGTCIAEYKQHSDRVLGIAVVPDCLQTLSLGADRLLCVFDLDFQPTYLIPVSEEPEKCNKVENRATTAIATTQYSNDFTLVVVISPQSMNEIVTFARAENDNFVPVCTVTKQSHSHAHYVSIGMNSRELFAATSDNRIMKYRYLYQVEHGWTLQLTRDVHSFHPERVDSIVLCSSFMVSAGDDTFLRVWDNRLAGIQITQRFAGHAGNVHVCAFAPDNRYLVSVGQGIVVWNFWGVEPVDSIAIPYKVPVIDLQEEHLENECPTIELPSKHGYRLTNEIAEDCEDYVGHDTRALGFNIHGRNCVLWHPVSGQFLFAYGRIVVVEDLSNQEQTHYVKHTSDISTMAISTDGTLVASGSRNIEKRHGTAIIVIWKIQKDGELEGVSMVGHLKGGVQSLSFSSNNEILASLGNIFDRTISLWSCEYHTLLASHTPTDYIGHEISFTGDSLVTVGSGNCLRMWTREDMKLSFDSLQLHPIEAHATCVANAPSWLPPAHGSIVAVGDSSGNVHIIELPQLTILAMWHASPTEICFMSWQNRHLFIGTSQGSVIAWEIGDHYPESETSPLKTIHMGPASVTALNLRSNEGIAATQDGTVWYCSLDECIPIMYGCVLTQNIVSFRSSYISWGVNESSCILRDIHNPEIIADISMLENARCMCMPRDQILVTGTSDGQIIVLDIMSNDILYKIEVNTSHMVSVGNWLVYAGEHGGLQAREFNNECSKLLEEENILNGGCVHAIKTSWLAAFSFLCLLRDTITVHKLTGSQIDRIGTLEKVHFTFACFASDETFICADGKDVCLYKIHETPILLSKFSLPSLITVMCDGFIGTDSGVIYRVEDSQPIVFYTGHNHPVALIETIDGFLITASSNSDATKHTILNA